jgi:ABC-type multidrug transport system permease subunit
MFRSNEASALIVVPEGFQDALLNGRRAELIVFKNPIQTFSPEVVESVLEMTTVIANGLYAQAIDPISRIRQIAIAGRQATAAEAAEISTGFFTAGQRFGRLQTLNDMQVAVERPGRQASTRMGPSPEDFFGTIFPGLAVFALMFIGSSLALRLLRDRVRGLPQRLAIAPVSRGALVAGNALYLFGGLLALLVVLALIGRVVFQIPLRQPFVLLLLGTGIALFVSGLHLAIIALSRSDRGASAISGGVILTLSLLSGTMVPIEQYPGFLQRIAMMTPNGPAQQGLVDVLVHRKGLVDVAGGLASVWIWGIVLIALSLRLERRAMGR